MIIPEGYKLVPVEPTDEMLYTASWVHGPGGFGEVKRRIGLEYRAALSVAPTPPQPIYDEAVNAAVLGAQNLNAAMATIDILRAQLAERDALLTDLGVEPDGVSDVYQRLLLNAERYEYLREHMAVENFPSEHPDWSQPSEYESRRIDELCDSAMSRAKAGEVEVCIHDWVDARNQVVKSGELCTKCFAIRSGNSATDGAKVGEVGHE